ncbi:MAG: acyltransferase [Deltaproteobacteria bacterium]|nr:acyltransferase [Deltaproteobacteria bacterium]
MNLQERQLLDEVRVKSLFEEEGGLVKKYKKFVVGGQGWWALFKYELIVTFFGWIPGALGLTLRYFFYPFLFKKVGKKVIFGRDMNLRSPHKITIGDHVIFDDDVFLDAKGSTNTGIQIGNKIFIGENTIIQTKNGDIVLEDEVNIGPQCYLASTNLLHIGARTYIGPYCLFMSGGEHDVNSPQMEPGRSLPLNIGEDCWIAAKVTVFQDCHIGNHSVVGTASLVNSPIPPDSIAVGTPARVVKTLSTKE